VLVLAVWSACTGHCAIENLSGSTDSSCCNEGGSPTDQAPNAPGQCVCSAIQTGGYVSQESALQIPLPLDVLWLLATPLRPEALLTGPGLLETSLAPDTLRPWQFIFRAALPVRAPSFAS